MLLGLIGAVVPLLPGPLIIWIGAFVWAWGDGFTRVGWVTLAVLFVLALVAWASDFLINMLVSRRAGARWKAIFGSIVGGIAGGIALSGLLPIIGSLVGAILGAVAGAFAVEYWNTRNSQQAFVAVRAYIGSVLLASLVEIAIAVSMIGIFAWSAFL
jgi:uncharacterized protein YqgC (DUF456 family)